MKRAISLHRHELFYILWSQNHEKAAARRRCWKNLNLIFCRTRMTDRTSLPDPTNPPDPGAAAVDLVVVPQTTG